MSEERKMIHDGDIDTKRERLYQREEKRVPEHLQRYTRERYKAPEQSKEVTDWDIPEEALRSNTVYEENPKKSSYRAIILTFGVLFFIISTAVAALYLVFGNQDISGNNIRITVDAPYAVGGGEAANITVSIANQNPTAITDAELIVEYPQGTEIDGERSRELVVKRYPLNTVASGDVVNTQLRPRLFGEENSEKFIHVSIEYKVVGSAATFYRENDPVRIVMSSSPVTIVLNSVSSITAGQEYVLTATLISNSDVDLTNLLVQATYPRTFDVKLTEPAAVSGRNTWRIEKLSPGKQTEIKIVGILSGEQETVQAIDIAVGLASQVDVSKLASTLSTARVEVLMEAPFLNVSLQANNEFDEIVAFDVGREVQMEAEITNPLTQPIYDIALNVRLSGTAADLTKVSAENGYIDLGAGIITFDKIENDTLGRLNPGESRSITFSFIPKADVRTPEIIVTVDVAAARIDSATAARDLSVVQKKTIRFISGVSAFSGVEYIEGVYPPRVGQTTRYQATLSIQGGGNESREAKLTAVIPRGVEVGVLPSDAVFNSENRTLVWTIGTIAPNEPKTLVVPLMYTPTVLDIERSPTLMQTQKIESIDQFTKRRVTLQLQPITTVVSNRQEGGDVER